MDAMRAHRTQIAVDGPFFALANNKGNEIWGIEFFRIAKGTPHLLSPGSWRRTCSPGSRESCVKSSQPLGAKVAGFTILGLLLLVGGLWVGVYLYAGDEAPRNAQVEGAAARVRRAGPGSRSGR